MLKFTKNRTYPHVDFKYFFLLFRNASAIYFFRQFSDLFFVCVVELIEAEFF